MFEDRPDRDAEVVLVGRSNVGKSTLMRELTGHDFSTGGKPGVTRQPNHFDWASESFMFTDLPPGSGSCLASKRSTARRSKRTSSAI